MGAILFALLVPTLLAACGATPGTSSTNPRTACDPATQWRPPAGNVELDDLAMVGPDEGWAVGAITPAFPSATTPAPATREPIGVIYHLTHGQWQRLPREYPGAGLSAISMGAPEDGWAVSTQPTTAASGQVLVLHYTGGQWQPVDIPALDAVLKPTAQYEGGHIIWINLQMFGPDAGWMFAWTNVPREPGSRSGAIILRYAHGVWTPIRLPNVTPSTDLFQLSAVSADEAWIVGTDYGANLTTIFAHYHNGAWSLAPRTFPGVTERFTMLSPLEGWAFDSGGGPDLLLHFDGTAWAQAATPPEWASRNVHLVSTVWEMAPGILWFPAINGTHPTTDDLIEQYAQGQWQELPWPFGEVVPTRLAAGAQGELWGVGNIEHQEGCAPALVASIGQGVFLHYAQGRWQTDVLP